jgi:hypothetical protein
MEKHQAQGADGPQPAGVDTGGRIDPERQQGQFEPECGQAGDPRQDSFNASFRERRRYR